MKSAAPPVGLSTAVVLLMVVFWAYLRLQVFRHEFIPLSFILPLLSCVWTRQRWQLWGMAGIFSAMTFYKATLLFPASDRDEAGYYLFLASTHVNILVGAAVVHAIITLRESLEHRNAVVTEQNAELEAQTEELSQQNEEIKAQAEELAEQNEEIEAQSEEVSRQNEDLTELNHRLADRESLLQGLLGASREQDSVARVLDELCRRLLKVVGSPAAAVAVLEQRGDHLGVICQAGGEQAPLLPEHWPMTNSIAGVVLKEDRTAYVSDVTQDAELAAPFGMDGEYKSVLATPVSLAGLNHGLLVACSMEAAHWTEEQFHLIEWVAGQCGPILETLKNQKAISEHAEALQAANDAKDTFLAMLSHELRTPLTPILITSEMLAHDTRLPDEIRKDCEMIRRNIGVQCRLIDDLLDLTRINHGKMALEQQTLSIAGLLREAVRFIEKDLLAKNQNLKLEIDPIHDCAVMGDGPRLQQVFWNLLKNANKFSEPGTTIAVSGRRKDHCVIVEIRDQGCGIPADHLDQIFLAFEQAASRVRRTGDGGLGLGLAIAKAIVEKHGGSLSVHSDGHGKGSSFTVSFPEAAWSRSERALIQGDSTLQGGLGDRSIRILLVEDHGDTGRAIAGLLAAWGCKVEHAESAGQALELFRRCEFDLVISDLGLPDESGAVLISRLLALRPELPAICISGFGMERDIEETTKAGFRAHLTKPVDPTRLRAAIDSILNNSVYGESAGMEAGRTTEP